MSLDVMALNASNGFGEGYNGRAADMMALVREMEPDAAVFPEAYAGKNPLLSHVPERFADMGYMVATGDNDVDGRTDTQGMLFIARRESLLRGTPLEQYKLNGRVAVKATMQDPYTGKLVRAVGVHLEDRNEATRLKQVDQLIDPITSGPFPAVILGDLNALHPANRSTRLLGSKAARAVADVLPHNRARSLATRLCEMADGSTMSKLLTIFDEADPLHQATYPSRFPLFQLDHIMVTPDIKVDNFQVSDWLKASDHRAVMAQISLKSAV